MTVSLEATEAQAASLSTAMIQQLHSEPNLRLHMPAMTADIVHSQQAFLTTSLQLQARVMEGHPVPPVDVGKC